jgi:hypothetical protein
VKNCCLGWQSFDATVALQRMGREVIDQMLNGKAIHVIGQKE